MKVPCPQCGGEVQLQETTGFVGCPFCSTSLVLDLTGVRPHLFCRPRHPVADVVPLLRRWRDVHGLPPLSGVSPPHLVYRPFWRYLISGHPRLAPAWPAIEAAWADVPPPEAEQAIYDAALVGGARVIESSVAEAAARRRLFGDQAASVAAGDLVHVPFFEVQATLGLERLTLNLEACSGRVYPDRIPAGVPSSRMRGPSAVITAILGFFAMFLEAMLIPSVWPATILVALTGMGLYVVIVGGERRSAS